MFHAGVSALNVAEPVVRTRSATRLSAFRPFRLSDNHILRQPEGFWSTVRRKLSMVRIAFLLVSCSLAFFACTILDETSFKVTVGSDLAVQNRAGCQALCQRTHYNFKAFKRFGGSGICKEKDGNQTRYLAKFEFCGWQHARDGDLRKVCSTVREWSNKKTVRVWGTTRCTFKVIVNRWKPGFVFVVTAATVFFIVQKAPPELCFLLACCALAAAQIITPMEAFGGLSNPSIVSLTFLFPITKAVEQTGLLNKILLRVLGSPGHQFIGVLKMYTMVMLMSGIMANAPLTVTMQPLVTKFSRTLRIHPGKLLMPLAYSVMTGANLTAMGTISSLLAQQLVMEHYRMNMFDTFFTCLSVGLVMSPACALLSTTSLLRSSNASDQLLEPSLPTGHLKPEDYEVLFFVISNGSYDGAHAARSLEDLSCIPGVSSTVLEDDVAYLSAGQVISVRASPDGIARVRRVDGLLPTAASELVALGSCRRGRGLYEGAVASVADNDSPFAAFDAAELRERMGLALIASRGSCATKPWSSHDGGTLREGEVLLFEAHADDINRFKKLYSKAFTLVRAVPHSQPPRSGHKWDFMSALFILFTFLTLIALVRFGVVELHWGSGLALGVLLVTDRISWSEALSSINVPVLMVVGAGLGVAKAIEKTGIANFVADVAITVAQPAGLYGVAAAIYVVCFTLNLFLNQGAIVAIMAPVVIDIVQSSGEIGLREMKALVHVMVFSSTAALCSPLGSPPNLLVMKPGGYAFIDYVRFGVPLQLVHAAACIIFVPHITANWL